MVDGGFFDDAGSTCIEVNSRTGEIISTGKFAKIAGFGLDNVRMV